MNFMRCVSCGARSCGFSHITGWPFEAVKSLEVEMGDGWNMSGMYIYIYILYIYIY